MELPPSLLSGVDASVPLLCKSDGSVTCDSSEKARLLASIFDSWQNDFEVALPYSCASIFELNSFAFSSLVAENLLHDLGSYGSADPSGFLPLFKNVSFDCTKA